MIRYPVVRVGGRRQDLLAAGTIQNRGSNDTLAGFMTTRLSSDVNKDWTHKDQDKDKDQSHKDKDKDLTCKDKDKDKYLIYMHNTRFFKTMSLNVFKKHWNTK